MGRVHFAIAAFALGVSATAVSAADPLSEGFWTAATAFMPFEKACMREYRCNAPLSVFVNGSQTIEATAPRIMFGVCTAGDNSRPSTSSVEDLRRPSRRRFAEITPPSKPADTCEVCLTNAPVDRCEWRLVKR